MKKLLFILLFSSLFLSVSAQNNNCKISYTKLKENVSKIASHEYLAAFVNLDFGYSESMLQSYLLDVMGLTHNMKGCTWVNSKHWVEEYRAKVNFGEAVKYLKVHYYLKLTNDTRYLDFEGKCETLTKCVIEGTPTLVVQLFTHYWEKEIEIGGPNKNEKSHIDFLGDHIGLYHINDNLYRIVITDNGRGFNYKCNFSE